MNTETTRLKDYLQAGKHVHLIGIGGVSMRPLGLVLQGMGIHITCSDMNSSVSTNDLISVGIPVFIGHRAENITGADCIIRTAAAHNDNPEIQDARRQLKEWNDAGFFAPKGSSATQDQMAVWFTDGYRPGDVEDRAISRGRPIVAAQLSDYMMERKSANTTMTSISATSRNPEKAMQFLLEVNTNPDVFNLCAYGIKDKHYEMIDETHIKFIPDSGYKPGGNWKYGVLFNGYLLEGYADDLWTQIKAVNDNSRKAKLLGFVADTTPVVTNISQIANAISEFSDLNDGTAVDLAAKTAEYEKKMIASGRDVAVK